MNRDPLEQDIIVAAEAVQALVDSELAKCGGSPPKGSALEQCGLRDGRAIVVDYVDAGEAGLALEHVLYMVRETGVEVTLDVRERIHRAASAMKMTAEISPTAAPRNHPCALSSNVSPGAVAVYDFARYRDMRARSVPAPAVYAAAISIGMDRITAIRMIRAVYNLDLVQAMDVVAQSQVVEDFRRNSK